MSEERLEFGPSLRGLFIDALGPELTDAMKADLRAAGLNVDAPLLPAYPAATFAKCVRVVARGLKPDLSEDDALRSMGRRAVDGLSTNFIGRALLSVVRLLGIRRTLLRMERAFRNSNNYTRIETQQLTPTSMELTFNTVIGIPAYFEGVMSAVGEALGGSATQVESSPLDGERHRFVVHWKE
jgi:uncharacterized protein (TIGR02265 family)